MMRVHVLSDEVQPGRGDLSSHSRVLIVQPDRREAPGPAKPQIGNRGARATPAEALSKGVPGNGSGGAPLGR